MAQADIQLLKKLRNETSASIADCRVALEESENDYKKALEWLKKRGLEKADKKSDRATSQGLVEAYNCETDFVAKTDDFKNLSKELALQISAMNPENVDALLKQEYIRDSSQTIQELIKSVIGKLGENITVGRFHRIALGE
jgi:elongation factor Ts